MADKLQIILMNTPVTNGRGVAEALRQARVAAAMVFKVEVLFTGEAGILAMQGMAQDILLPPPAEGTAYQAIQEAVQAGVRFKVCATALAGHQDYTLIPEISETVGETYLISEAMDDETVTFTY